MATVPDKYENETFELTDEEMLFAKNRNAELQKIINENNAGQSGYGNPPLPEGDNKTGVPILEYSENKKRQEKIHKVSTNLSNNKLIPVNMDDRAKYRLINNLYEFNQIVNTTNNSFTQYEINTILLKNEDPGSKFIPLSKQEEEGKIKHEAKQVKTSQPKKLSEPELDAQHEILTYNNNTSRNEKIEYANQKLKHFYSSLYGSSTPIDYKPFIYKLYKYSKGKHDQIKFSINELKNVINGTILNRATSRYESVVPSGDFNDVPISNEEINIQKMKQETKNNLNEIRQKASQRANKSIKTDVHNNTMTRTQLASLNAFRGKPKGGSAKTRRRRARTMTRKRKSGAHVTRRCRSRRRHHVR